MSWLNRHKRVWRMIILILLLVAMAGPWWFDLINVPAQFKCSTAVRLEGDFCGIPIAGSWMPLTVLGGLVPMIVESLTGTAVLTNRIRDLFISLLMLLPVLPFISSLRMILGKQNHCWQVFHIIALGLAICYPLFMGANLGVAGYSGVWWMLWGLWLYIGVTVIALVLEVLTRNFLKAPEV